MNKFSWSLLVALTSVACGVFVSADEHLEEVVVEREALSMDNLNAVKTPTPALDVPQSLSIVSSGQIEAQAFRNLGDILRYTPGLSISQGEGHRDAMVIRGIQTTADFFIDGVRDDVQYFRPLYNVEQVEVLRGSNALLFGRGGGGGVINRVTKQPKIGSQFKALNFGVDSFGAFSFAGDANFTAGDGVAFRMNAYYQQLDNHRDFFDGESFAVNPTMKVNLGRSTTGILSYEYIDDDRVVDRGVPSQKVDDGPDVPLEGLDDAFFGSAENFTTLQAHILRARVDHEFHDTLRGNVTAQYADYDKLYQNLYPSAAIDTVNGQFDVTLDGYRDATERRNFIIQANLVGELTTASINHTLLFGVELGNQDTANSRLDNEFTASTHCVIDDQCTFPFTDPLNIPPFSFDPDPVRDRKSEVQFTSVYFQDQIDLNDHLKAIVGLRYDEFDIDVLDREVGDSFSRVDQELSPRLGVIYKPLEDISIYASYSETFLPRSGEQFLTLNLETESTRPQFFENSELGLKWDINPGLNLAASIFQLERESFTSTDPNDAAQVIVIEGSETSGFELQLSGALTKNWSLYAGYAYLDGVVERADGSGNDGNKTRQTPENMFSIWNNYQVNDKWSLGLGLTYQDDFFVLEDNAVQVPDFTRVDAAVFYNLTKATRVQLNVENLFDEDYFPDAHNNNNISTGEPINACLSIATRF